jgi:Na+/proline symporter
MNIKLILILLSIILLSIGLDMTRRLSKKNTNMAEQNKSIKTSGIIMTSIGSVGLLILLIGVIYMVKTGQINKAPKKIFALIFTILLIVLILGAHTVRIANSKKSEDDKQDIYVRMTFTISTIASFILGLAIASGFSSSISSKLDSVSENIPKM